MNESNIHRIAVTRAENQRPTKAVRVVGATIVGLVLLGGAIALLRPSSERAAAHTEKPAAVATIPPPPAGLTADRAAALAEERLLDGARSGASLADAWRLAVWAEALGKDAVQTDDLRRRIDEQLDVRWRRGRYAYLHARKLRNAVAADAALRTLRETFPREHPRSKDIDRMEMRP